MQHQVPNEITKLIEACTRYLLQAGRSSDDLRGVALFDTRKDAIVRDRPEFGPAAVIVKGIQGFDERIGGQPNAERVTIQLVFNHFAKVADLTLPLNAAGVWSDLVEEVSSANWTYLGVANLHHFKSDVDLIELGDGIAIRKRSFEYLQAIGFSEYVIAELSRDWSSGFGPSEFVMLVQENIPKSPDNLILSNGPTGEVNAQRAIGALRLVAPGDVRIGPIWLCRPDRIGLVGGVTRVGASIPAFGEDFTWKQEFTTGYQSVYQNLKNLEVRGYDQSPGNLHIALQSFMSTYDRWPTIRAQQLIDAITALEALFGTNNEITFRLAFRVAGLLADSGQERAQLFATVSEFYSTRSRIVHGGSLKGAHTQRLQRIEELRSILRRLLGLLIPYAANPPATLPRTSFDDGTFEQTLLDETTREQMRGVLLSLAKAEPR